ncbi:MAG: A/G-specific adenine glycosylase [Proteobacteria bacterium]|nr:MAG: A/G-specific adenine glycosylase [Pseudomonadota bacterium]
MTSFAVRVIEWQQLHGRHDLPWQGTRDPYRIWLSEIMLQQTQVAAVIPYYQRFLARFPDVGTLATANEEDVLSSWSGLGYYARGRNLHRTARLVMATYDGVFPAKFESVSALPGVGRSTAAAICVFAYGGRHAILDGNVKRVLARTFGIEGYPGDKVVQDRLWQQAEALLPDSEIAAYTQGLMDLGASVCVRRRPLCAACPVSATCVAYRAGTAHRLPSPRPAKLLPQRETTMLVLLSGAEVLLEKRPAPGIWGGLWSFPEMTGHDAAFAIQRFGAIDGPPAALAPIDHGFTHFRLRIHPLVARLRERWSSAEESGRLWLTPEDAKGAAIPVPVRRILEALHVDWMGQSGV